MRVIILVISLTFTFYAHAENYLDIKVGLCGPAEKMYSYIKESGYQSFPIGMSISSDDKLTWFFFPIPERIKEQRKKSWDYDRVYWDRLDILKVVHQDPSDTHPKGWTCISAINGIGANERKELTDYFKKINEILK